MFGKITVNDSARTYFSLNNCHAHNFRNVCGIGFVAASRKIGRDKFGNCDDLANVNEIFMLLTQFVHLYE